ncbi:MAG: nucleotide-binding universal stress UspA family protein [Crocinitomix sp.]|jgi:nucleotide-binding universal stress UspA family protein
MQKKEEIKEYNFLVLIDFSDEAYIALKYVISLAKEMGGSIQLFHVADMEKVTKSTNAIVIKQDIDEEGDKIKEKLKAIVEIIVAEGIAVTYEYSFGNYKDQIKNQIDFYNPDITIIGRRAIGSNRLGKVTNFLLNKNMGCVLIVSNSELFSSTTNISVACNKHTLDKSNLNMVHSLDNSVAPPLSIINILNNAEQEQEVQFTHAVEHFKKGKEKFKFSYPVNLNITEGLIEHIVQENIELLCIGRGKGAKCILNRIFAKESTTASIVAKVNVPVLILGNKKP